MDQNWQRLETWFAEFLPEMNRDLNGGCDHTAFTELEKEIGVQLPQSFKDFYSAHDGQRATDYMGLFYGASLLPLSKILEQWRIWASIIAEYGPEQMKIDFDQYQTSLMPAKVKAMYANNKWVPFAVIWDCNYLGLDFDPGPTGKSGQMINFGREEEQKSVLADSFAEFVERYISELESGEVVFEDSAFFPKRFEWRFKGGGSRLLGYVAHRFVEEPSKEEQERLGILL